MNIDEIKEARRTFRNVRNSIERAARRLPGPKAKARIRAILRNRYHWDRVKSRNDEATMHLQAILEAKHHE